MEARLQEREQPRKRRSSVEFAVRGEHLRLVPDPCRHVDHVAGVHARLSPEGLRRRQISVTEQTRGLQAGRHPKLQRHGYPSFDHAVMLRRTNGRVLAADATRVEHRHELRLDELGAVVRAKALHDGRDTFGVDVGQKTSEGHRDVGLALQEIRPAHPRVVVDDHH